MHLVPCLSDVVYGRVREVMDCARFLCGNGSFSGQDDIKAVFNVKKDRK